MAPTIRGSAAATLRSRGLRGRAPSALRLYESKGELTSGAQVDSVMTSTERHRGPRSSWSRGLCIEPRAEPWGRSARYRDNEANVVELTQTELMSASCLSRDRQLMVWFRVKFAGAVQP